MREGTAKLLLNINLLEINRLTEFVKNEYNYDFTNYALASFKRRVANILFEEKLSTIAELIIKFQTTPSFFSRFLNYITVNVTEMFRDPSFWLYFREELMTSYCENKKNIKIWHAGCSSGEEVYSMCILLKELGLLNQTSITASDIDDNILDQAKEGKYPIKQLYTNNKNYKDAGGTNHLANYTCTDTLHFYINKEIKEAVTFKKNNLVNEIEIGEFDIILCRNVLIYFNQDLQNSVLNTLLKNLKPEGILAIGTKESLIWCDNFKNFDRLSLEEKTFIKISD